MKLEIIPDEKVIGTIDLTKFRKIMKETDLDLEKAVNESTIVTKNETKWDDQYIKKIIFAEIDWTPIFMKLKLKEKEFVHFRICPIKFESKVEYERLSKTQDYSGIVLKESRKNGKGYILINSFTSSPEHTIDTWLGKNIFPYTESSWKEIVKEM